VLRSRALWLWLVQNRARPKFVAMNAQRRRWGNRMLFACRLMELEATPGIEPGYTVLQSDQGTSRVALLIWGALISLRFV
jgi:hypothetical protein